MYEPNTWSTGLRNYDSIVDSLSALHFFISGVLFEKMGINDEADAIFPEMQSQGN